MGIDDFSLEKKSPFIPPRNYLFEANEHKGCSISSSSESLVAQNVELGLIIGWS